MYRLAQIENTLAQAIEFYKEQPDRNQRDPLELREANRGRW